jgi:Undecaprenyl-phosphate galactose phosphotransferase WbaP
MATATLQREDQPPDPKSVKGPSGSRSHARRLFCVAGLLFGDVLAIALSLRLAITLRVYLLPVIDKGAPPYTFSFRHYMVFGWLWLLVLFFLCVEGLYTQRRTLWNEVGHLTKATALGLTTVLATVALEQLGLLVSRPTILLTGISLLFVLPVIRYGTKRILGIAGLWRKRILILGAAETGKVAFRGLKNDPILGYEIVGFLDDDPAKIGRRMGSCHGKPVHVLGPLSEAVNQLRQTRAADFLIAMPGLPEQRLVKLVHSLQPYCESIYVVPQVWALPMMNLQIDGFLQERLMMLRLSNNLAKPWNVWLKRGFDLLSGGVLTVALFPLWFVLALLIKLDSKGPIFFVQERLGYQGKRFRCLKFRTMLMDGDQRLQDHLQSSPDAREEWEEYAKLRSYDPRLTRLGRFLRRWSLDEMPQLINVLRGDMSLVGPRPYMPGERNRIGSSLPIILSARPGVTGFWQVSGRNHVTFKERVELEVWYVRNWTPWLDCIVLAKTLRTVLFPRKHAGTSHELTFHDPES